MNVIEVKGNEMGSKNKQFALELQTLCVCVCVWVSDEEGREGRGRERGGLID